jgi:urease accessory protein
MSHTHSSLADHSHGHGSQEHGHSHEILDGPGSFLGRELPIVDGRDWRERAFTVGIGGYDDARFENLFSHSWICPSNDFSILAKMKKK